MARRTPETLADYLVVAICPALIMGLVGSLLFFLVEVFYQGQFELRLLFVLAMFVMAIVCITRIAMEEGRAYATLFALPIAVLVGIALARFVEIRGPLAPFSGPINWTLMAIVWAAAHRLTWDCTLIDDSQDSSGAGLLAQMGLDEGGPVSGLSTIAVPEATTSGAAEGPATGSWWQNLIEPDRSPHPPGVWVVVFSLAALPLFGIGGRFIAAENLESRRWCFWMLVIYVASAMALLLATSFLGMRKYLRQRRLEMPLEMAGAWVGAGLVLIVATIVIAALIPRPSPEYSVTQLVDFDSPELWASRWGIGPEGGKSKPDSPSQSGAEQQEGQQADQQGGGKADPKNKDGSASDSGKSKGGKSDGKGEPSQSGQSKSDQSQSTQSKSNQSNQSDQSKSDQDNQKSQDSPEQQSQQQQGQSSQQQGQQDQSSTKSNESKQSSGEQRSGNQDSSKQQDQQSPADDSQKRESSSSSNPAANPSAPTAQIMQHVQTVINWLGGLLKTVFYLALALVAAILAWRYRAGLLAAWKKLVAELADLWARWFGKATSAAADPPEEASAPPRPFAAFSDPFASGQSARMSPAEIVRYTFLALEAWGRENGCPRAAGQTPHEFAAAIGQLDSSLAREAAQLAELYARMAYAQPAAIRTSFEPVRSLWQKMQSPAVAAV